MPPGAFANRLDTGLVRVSPSQLLNGRKPGPEDVRVSLALYKPQFHVGEQRWYADIVIKPDKTLIFLLFACVWLRINQMPLKGANYLKSSVLNSFSLFLSALHGTGEKVQNQGIRTEHHDCRTFFIGLV
ncbi:hypothetical protein PMI35_03726 [Pseudomonas sp. GM78]|nr:hypothetical protein PMI35_03726 [Pseudomonas sp. GM78]